MIGAVLFAFMLVCLFFTIAQYGFMLMWAGLASKMIGRRRSGNREIALAKVRHGGQELPGVSIVMPAYNEEAMICDTVASALDQDYPNIEVVVVNDGSKDNTVGALVEKFDMAEFPPDPRGGLIQTKEVRAIWRSRLDPRFVLVDKAPSGAKADGANAGINVARHPWVVVMDADEFMENDVISRCMAEVVSAPDDVVAVGTSLLPANDIVIDGTRIVDREVSRNYWVGCQLIEYLTAFLVARPGLAHVHALPIVSGGFGAYKREAMLEVNGYKEGHLGEDMDMCLEIHRAHREAGKPYTVAQVPEAIVWTEFPSSREVLRRQRIRWHRGLKTILADHGNLMFSRKYGTLGVLGMGSLRLFEWYGPILEALGWVTLVVMLATGTIDPVNAMGVFVTTQILGMALTMLGVIMALTKLDIYTRVSDVFRLLLWVVAFNWGYRQLSLWWRVRSFFPGATGWGEMTRTGLKTVSNPS